MPSTDHGEQPRTMFAATRIEPKSKLPVRVTIHDAAAGRETARKLIEAAGDVFARKGFERATVREIVRIAGVNVAAISYHFNDKRGIYLATLKEASIRAAAHADVAHAALDETNPLEALRQVCSTLARLWNDDHAPTWPRALLCRELLDPHGNLDAVVHYRTSPHQLRIRAAVRDVLGARADEPTVSRCCFAILSRCVGTYALRNMFLTIDKEPLAPGAPTQQTIENIVTMLVAGVTKVRDEIAAAISPATTGAK